MWEFFSGSETADDWTTRLTIIDRPDARSKSDIDKVSEGIKSDYEAHGGRVLIARTIEDPNGAPYHYTVVVSDEPSKQRTELSFVKAAISRRDAYVVVYAVRISDPNDYSSKAKAFLHQHSAEINNALGQAELPDMNKLPRTEF
ncbi:MAG: hypothetical protein ABSF98_06360 [Bryobacteraceae bacterium]